MAAIDHSPLPLDVGVEVHGLDLARPLAADVVAALNQLLPQRGVLLFRGQQLTPDDQVRFMTGFCAIRPHHGVETAAADAPKVAVLSNIVRDGKPIGFQHKLGVEWHTDGSGWRQCTVATSLYAVEVPASGGDTLFVNGYAAYRSLGPARRAEADAMRIVYSRRQLIEKLARASGTHQPLSPEEQAQFPDIVRPLVSLHPATGRRAATMSIEEAAGIEGMSASDAEVALHSMLDELTAEPLVYRHRWRVGDLIIWDNRCMMHSPTEYTYEGDRRLMQRVIGWDPDPALGADLHTTAA